MTDKLGAIAFGTVAGPASPKRVLEGHRAELIGMVERLLGRIGIDSCAYDAELYKEAETLLAKIGGDAGSITIARSGK